MYLYSCFTCSFFTCLNCLIYSFCSLLVQGLRERIEFYFYRDDDGGLTYGIEDAAKLLPPNPDPDVTAVYRGVDYEEMEREAFYARFAATMAEIGYPSFLTGEAQVQGWFESADRANFDEHVAMCMYKAMLRAKHADYCEARCAH